MGALRLPGLLGTWMDALIASYPGVHDNDLMICEERGVAYQIDMASGRVSYGNDYLKKVDGYADTDVSRKVNAGRCEMLARHLKPQASVLDIGAGSGAFISAARAAGFMAYGYEVMPAAADRLRSGGMYTESTDGFDALTFWDSIEHMDEPAKWFSGLRDGVKVFVSLPLFEDLWSIRGSKHYRPGEHLQYFTAWGFTSWMQQQGFIGLEFSAHETDAGRENIGAFAFEKR